MGGQAPRPRRPRLHRSSRRLGPSAGGHPRRAARGHRRPRPPQRVLHQGHRGRRGAARGQREPGSPDRPDRGRHHRARGAQHLRAAAVPDRRAGHRRRGGPPAVPLPGSPPPRTRRRDPPALRRQQGGPHRPWRAQLRRDRDADADPLNPRGRPRLHRAGPPVARLLVRAAAVTAALQAAAHGGGHGALLPDRALLPRRGLPRRPAARVHPAGHRDELRGPGRRDRAGRGAGQGDLGTDRCGPCHALPEDHLPRLHEPLRLGQARPALRPGADRTHRLLLRDHLPGVPGPLRRRHRDARRRLAAAAHLRRVAGVGQAARRQGPRLRHARRERRAGRPRREEPLRPGAGRARRDHRRQAGRLHLLRRRREGRVTGAPGRRPQRDRRALRPDRPGRVELPLGGRRAAVQAHLRCQGRG